MRPEPRHGIYVVPRNARRTFHVPRMFRHKKIRHGLMHQAEHPCFASRRLRAGIPAAPACACAKTRGTA
ncbi:MAG: hypothetical protein DESF_00336 [Desulfovibrio sp.]